MEPTLLGATLLGLMWEPAVYFVPHSGVKGLSARDRESFSVISIEIFHI